MTTETNAEWLEIIRDKQMQMHALSTFDVNWLIQQVERVQELERLLNESKDGLYWNNLSLLHWKAENARLRKTLEFYADKESYKVNVADQWEPVCPILQDDGKKARQTLKGESP